MCEKCQDRGFIEENHGLIVTACDCEAGKEYRARMTAILGIPEEETLTEVAAEANAYANALMPKLEGEERFDSGIGQPNSDTGSGDTSEPKQPGKRKAKKRARKRTS